MLAQQVEHQPNVIWKPQDGSQSLFLSCPFNEILYEGSRGPGKTDALLMRFARNVGVGYGDHWRGIIFRREFKELGDIVTKSKRWFRQIFPEARFLKSPQDYKWVFPDGEELLFRTFNGPDDYWNFHGHEYPFIGWEELTTWPNSESYLSMFSCNRTSYRPHFDKRGNQLGPDSLSCEVASTTNPWGRGHNWVKKYFINPAPAGVPFTADSGREAVRIFGHITENQFLSQEYIDEIRNIKEPNRRKAWWEGSWDITSGGAIDDLWDSDIHVIEPFIIPEGWHIDRSFDWGSSHPFSVGWWAESNGEEFLDLDGNTRWVPAGTLFRIAEWYGAEGPNKGLKMSASKIAKGIIGFEKQLLKGIIRNHKRVSAGPADNQIFNKVNENCIADDMANEGILWKRSDKSPGSRINGLQVVRDKMEASLEPEMENPGIFFFSTCVDSIEQLPALPRSSKNPDDVDTEAEDHIWDEVRYRSMFKKPVKSSVSTIPF